MYFDKFWVYLFPGHPIGDVFDKWDGGEPNNGNDNEDCVVLKKHGKLHDYPCFFKFPFICKKSLVSVQWNGECNMTNLGIFFYVLKFAYVLVANGASGLKYRLLTTLCLIKIQTAMCELCLIIILI